MKLQQRHCEGGLIHSSTVATRSFDKKRSKVNALVCDVVGVFGYYKSQHEIVRDRKCDDERSGWWIAALRPQIMSTDRVSR